jgi:two-component system LytT family sensor kinase
MLQENVQEKIPLVRDLEYLNNFIALQRLRTDINPNIKIQIFIQQDVNPALQIAPMLLIPFIENAFKHGISLREESIIRVSMELKESILYFDVFNTKHIRSENDPEKNSNGIGLMNVKQRLQLVYSGKHELVIRETTNDYFVHLVITLA